MAEPDSPATPPKEEASSGWWDAIMSSAEKVIEVYKDDLAEFVGAVATDTGQAVEEVKRADIVGQARSAAANSTVLSQLVDVIQSSVADDTSGAAEPGSRLEAKLAELQRDMGTFCTVPSDAGFAAFDASFDEKAQEEEIALMLSDSPNLLAIQSRLVPVVVSYREFWSRYMFRELRLREREHERADLIRSAGAEVASVDTGGVTGGLPEEDWGDWASPALATDSVTDTLGSDGANGGENGEEAVAALGVEDWGDWGEDSSGAVAGQNDGEDVGDGVDVVQAGLEEVSVADATAGDDDWGTWE